MNPLPFPSTIPGIWPWLKRHPLFPMLIVCGAASALSVALILTRFVLTGTARLAFIPFNLVLAFLPVIFLMISEDTRQRLSVVAGGALWLLFLPNAPYMLTDLIHYDRNLGNIAWLDMMALLAAAWAALISGMTTLRLMQDRVSRAFSGKAGHALVLGVLLLSSLGIYIGRFLRFHSWHALLKPWDVLHETASHYLHPAAYPVAWPFTLSVFGLLVCVHYSLSAFTHATGAVSRSERIHSAPSA